mmetsp:Transcript_23733/g.27066  ORF Transcript_23733/g.27066 Transcript_23733/m.27066 type:complete len:629 (+) Transcript_23733:111-1997(+)
MGKHSLLDKQMKKVSVAAGQRGNIIQCIVLRRNIIIIVVTVFVFGMQTIFISHITTNIDINNYDDISHRSPDAYINTFPLYLRKSDYIHSTVHCVGETHDDKSAWKHRSCSYVHLCIDFSSSSNGNNNNKNEASPPEFFVVTSQLDEEFRKRFRQSRSKRGGMYHYSSTEIDNSMRSKNKSDVNNDNQHPSPIDVALGGINPRWKGSTRIQRHGVEKVRWKPKVYDKFPFQYYYELDHDVVMIPFHSFAADNVGHLLWDDLLPIHNLITIFGYENNNNNKDSINVNNDDNEYRHFLIRVDTLPQLYGTCDLRPKKKKACKKNFERFLPLFGVDPDTFTTLTDIRLTNTNTKSNRKSDFNFDFQKQSLSSSSSSSLLSKYPVVCSKHAVAGLGLLTDHGIRDHGWMTNNEQYPLDVAIARNIGRGPELYAFRNFILRNIGLLSKTVSKKTSMTMNVDMNLNLNSNFNQPIQFRIILSAHSSNYPQRNFDFEEQQKALSEAFPTTDVSTVVLSKFPLREQIELISQPKQFSNKEHIIFITACGGGSVTGFFLPRGSSMILYYDESGGHDFLSKFNMTGGQAMLDWDLLNNLGYIRAHWLTIGKMNEPEGLDALVYLVRHEMDVTINGLLS